LRQCKNPPWLWITVPTPAAEALRRFCAHAAKVRFDPMRSGKGFGRKRSAFVKIEQSRALDRRSAHPKECIGFEKLETGW